MSAPRHRLQSYAAAFIGLALAGHSALAAPLSVEELNSVADKWSSFAEAKLPFTVEGRYSSIARGSLRMRNCELHFKPATNTDLRKPLGVSGVIEVAGHLALEGNRPVFVVESIRELPSDAESFRRRSAALKRDDPEGWYRLAEWGAARGRFYRDEELQQSATAATRKGIEIERARIAPDNPEGYFTLAAKVAEFKLPERLREELVHEGHRRQWDRMRAEKSPDYAAVAAGLARDLPGAEVPLQPPLPKLEQRYNAAPLDVYRDAEADDRRRLHRIFLASVKLEQILKTADPGGKNGFAIAQEIDRQVPEQHELAESWRDRELARRFDAIATAPRSEALELSEQYRGRNRPEQARATLHVWLAAREKAVAADDPDGLRLLAEEYLTLLEDEPRAVDLLIAAHRASPESAEIAGRLDRLGYRFQNGKWITARELSAIPVDPEVAAMREGRVIAGMTREQVRKALGAPTQAARIASAGDVSEVWVYGARTGTRLSIHFSRAAGSAPRKVTLVQQIRPEGP